MLHCRRSTIAAVLVVMAAAQISIALAQPPAADREAMGLTALINRLGGAAPDGTGVTVTQVEAPLTPGGNNYLPDASLSQFASDTIIAKTLGGTVSTHASGDGLAWYGSLGVSPGVNTIDVYNANSWTLDFLKLSDRFAPLVETRSVMNHSWFSTLSGSGDQDAVFRLDLIAKRDNVVIVAGSNNGSGTTVPQFPASFYNGITTGLSNGNSSLGPTILDPGRSKPDIAVPATTNSLGAAWVSGAASILVETAGANVNARKNTSIKAARLAGATKREFDLNNSTPTTFDDWSHTPTQPLDRRYGAGELNIDNSQRILASPEQNASTVSDVSLTGWDYGTASSTVSQQYFFTIPTGRVAESVSIIAAWNRDIAYTQGKAGGSATFTPSMADIDLMLSKAPGFSTGDLLESSISDIDNVEHIYVHGLKPGHYVISVPSDQTWDYSLAWDVLLAVPGDANGDGIVDGSDYTIWADHYLMTDATLDDGDFNGDCIVDGADYTLWADNFAPNPALASALSVPEPASWSLLLWGVTVLTMAALGRRLLRGVSNA